MNIIIITTKDVINKGFNSFGVNEFESLYGLLRDNLSDKIKVFVPNGKSDPLVLKNFFAKDEDEDEDEDEGYFDEGSTFQYLRAYDRKMMETESFSNYNEYETYFKGQIQESIRLSFEGHGLDCLFNKRIGDDYSIWKYGVRDTGSSEVRVDYESLINCLIKDIYTYENGRDGASVDSISVFLHNRDFPRTKSGSGKMTDENECKTYAGGMKNVTFFHFSHVECDIYSAIKELTKPDKKIDVKWCENITGCSKKKQEETEILIKETDPSYSRIIP